MAAVAASVRSDRTVLPTLITGHKVSQQAPKTPLTSDEAKQLQALMRGVVTDGSGRFLADIPGGVGDVSQEARSEEHTSELQSLMRISYAVFCLKKKKNKNTHEKQQKEVQITMKQ